MKQIREPRNKTHRFYESLIYDKSGGTHPGRNDYSINNDRKIGLHMKKVKNISFPYNIYT